MTDHVHELAGAELDKVLLGVWLSGFKSGVGTMVANQVSSDATADVRKLIASSVATRLTAQAYEDPATRLVVDASIRESLRCSLHDPHDPTLITVKRV